MKLSFFSFICVVFCMMWIIGCSTGSGPDGNGSGELSVNVDMTLFGNGPYSISGTVTLPETAGSGNPIYLVLYQDAGPNQEFVSTGASTTSDKTIDYTINKLSDDDYNVAIIIDTNGLPLGNSGDLVGYYDGTVDTPIQSPISAAVVTVSGSSVSDIDFGVGVR